MLANVCVCVHVSMRCVRFALIQIGACRYVDCDNICIPLCHLQLAALVI